ncbi:uncharacterized protein LOC129616304 [Condylostylus longicornis]|uniref:uncharacterized protein LOC129616304 n=1 Tax=Condylostylus longicornis TaxID=2530218 RepID=UPI00244DF54D|nr:uncharacterized protein LOC129616304 [Condylostylus longicornis]
MENETKLKEIDIVDTGSFFLKKQSLPHLQNKNVEYTSGEKVHVDWDTLSGISTPGRTSKMTANIDKNVDILHVNENNLIKQEIVKFKIKFNAVKNNVKYNEIISTQDNDCRKEGSKNNFNFEDQKNFSNGKIDNLLKKGVNKDSDYLETLKNFSKKNKRKTVKFGNHANMESLLPTLPIASPDLFENLINVDDFQNEKQQKQGEEESELCPEVTKNENEILNSIKHFLNNTKAINLEIKFQSQLENLIVLNRNKILNFCHNKNSCKHKVRGLVSFEDITKISWPQTLSLKYYGVNYNLSTRTEEIEYLYLSIIDRFVKSETRSSFKSSPNNKIKKHFGAVPQSPRSRLSHLAKRRATFSSENLLVASQKTKNAIRKKQIAMTSIKSQPVLKNKVITPRKKIVINNNNTNYCTPSSIKRSKDSTDCDNIFSKTTSNQILFSSSLQSVSVFTQKSECMTHPHVAYRIEKSKRALFSPENLKQKPFEKKHLLEKEPFLKKRKITHAEANSEELSDNDFAKPLKCKSQNYCEDLVQFSSSITQENSLKQCSSDTNFSNQLSDSHKKKLLWAVSKALQNQKIGVSHPKFKSYVSTLARAVKRLFLQFYKKRNSTSEVLLKLSKKYVYSVINEKTADEIYLMEKIEFENRTQGIKTVFSGHPMPLLEKGAIPNTKQSSAYLTSNDFIERIYDSTLNLNNDIVRNDENKSNKFPIFMIRSNSALQSSASKKHLDIIKIDNNTYIERKSGRKCFTGKDESNISPCLEKSYNRINFNDLPNTAKSRNFMSAKRRISFDE